MLFADRLEVVNSGRLPPALTVEKLRVAHQSLPGNPLLAEAMYLLRYIEKAPQLPKRRFATRSWTTCGSSPSSPGRR